MKKTEIINPLKLLKPQRLDIVVKYLYIKAYLKKKNYKFYKELYIKHILLRTGGFEDDKYSAKDYINSFNNLIISMSNHGFDSNFSIPVSKVNGVILDGAHRLACAIYFNLSVSVHFVQEEGRSWDYNWFDRMEFRDEITQILNEYTKLKSDNTFFAILWGSSKENWNEIENIIKNNFGIVGFKNLDLNDRASCSALIIDIYAYEYGLRKQINIINKANEIANSSKDIKVLLFDIDSPNYYIKNNQKVCVESDSVKNFIRNKLNNNKELKKYTTLHTSDNPSHTKYLNDILLNDYNLKLLNLRRGNLYSKRLIEWLDEYLKVLAKFNIDKNDTCIVGSTSLEVLGIRKTTDIDFILKSYIRRRLFSDENKQLHSHVDIASKGYHIKAHLKSSIDDDDIIDEYSNHFYFLGLKFVTLNIIKERKIEQKRPKDLKDVILIERYLRKNSKNVKFNLIKKVKEIYIMKIRFGILLKLRIFMSTLLTEKQKLFIKKIIKKK